MTFDHWGEPVPLDGAEALPAFPVEALPAALGDWVSAMSQATQTPPDLAAALSLAVVSAAVQGRRVIEVKDGWVEPLSTYWLIAMLSGERKTPVFTAAKAPLEAYEREQADSVGCALAEYTAKHDALERAYKRALQRAAADPLDTTEAAALKLQLDTLPRPSLGRIIADDVTPEKLATLMADNNERIAILSDEGGLFETVAGRYSDGIPNLDLILKAYDGSAARVDRIGRAPVFMDRPALTIGLAVQPDVMRGLAQKRGFRGRGLLARFGFVIPASRVGSRSNEPPAVPDEVAAGYSVAVDQLANAPALDRPLRLDGDAYGALVAFADEIEPRLVEDLNSVSDWAAKLIGRTARIAGLLHSVSSVNCHVGAETSGTSVGGRTMNGSICISRYLLEHAQAAFSLMGTGGQVDGPKLLLGWIRRKRPAAFTRRELHRDHQHTFKHAEDLSAPLTTLEQHGYIRRDEHAATQRGRPSESWTVNPLS